MSYNSRSAQDTFNRMVGTVIGTVVGHIDDDYDLTAGILSCYGTVCKAISSGEAFNKSAEIVLVGSSAEQAEAIHVVVCDEAGLVIDTFGKENRITEDAYTCVSKYPDNPQTLPVIGRLAMSEFYQRCEEAIDANNKQVLAM